MTDLAHRTGLPEGLRILADQMPRDTWEGHENFDGLTRFWMERHLMFREVLGRLQTGSQAYLDGNREAQSYIHETGRYAGFLLNQLHEHHTIEDDHYFPKLTILEPRLMAGFELLDRDHQALDGHISALADRTNAVLRGVSRDTAGALETHLAQFKTFLNRHLLDEEDLVVPIILTHGGVDL
ncbi:hemerythrin domain-containing protein [Oceaniglobus ichthyenteri]|uniref:hemerythrin domain-containing protein n=1 Tax=Oceaniglobus ichthyenteri TaxID=2136177 RepID=UPI000D3A8D4E|nr:hemerythrin domain-containing protein [Oceaniglobus ichthyenteri]